jgi:uncharacterized membrane protein YedE/YeeE
MKNPLTVSRWSPYAAGAALGVLSWGTFYFMDRALGVSTSVCHIAASAIGMANEQAVRENAYFAKLLVKDGAWKPVVDWQFALMVALLLGGFLAAWLGRSFDRTRGVPQIWSVRFGPSRLLRWGVAFLGGIILIFGARLADGCTSGHAISGGLQLALSSWVFTGSMFASGIIAGLVLFGLPGRAGGSTHV